MAKVSFCGMGMMGVPMARRLVQAGHEVRVWNRSPEKAAPVVEQGALQAGSLAEAARHAEAVITMLTSPGALEDVVFGTEGADGLVEGLSGGTTLIDMSTVGPQTVRGIARRLPEGVEMVDAPVLGTVPQAADGSLKIFVGGPEETAHRWFELLEAMGTPRYLGPLGAGASMKLVVNSTLMVLMTGLGEALALGDSLGLDQSAVLDVLVDSAIGVTARSKRPHVESGEYPPDFKLDLARKDAALVVATARAAGIALPVGEAARGWMQLADRAGLGGLDYSAVIAHIRGVPVATAGE